MLRHSATANSKAWFVMLFVLVQSGGFSLWSTSVGRRRLALAAMALSLSMAGCTAEEKFEEEPIKANLRQINKAYWMHLGYHNSPPKPEDLRQDVDGLHRLELGAPLTRPWFRRGTSSPSSLSTAPTTRRRATPSWLMKRKAPTTHAG